MEMMTKSKVEISASFKSEKADETIKQITEIINESKSGSNVSIETKVTECKNEKIGFHKTE